MNVPNYKTAFGSFLRTEDLQGKAIKLTIDSVASEEIESEHGKEKKLVARFRGKDKGLVLNRTNADALAEISGSEDTDDWAGLTIGLYPDTTKFGGKTVPCMRIRAVNGQARPTTPPPPPEPVQELTEDDISF